MSAKNLIKLATCCLCNDLMIETNILLVNNFGNVCENCCKDEKNVDFFKNRICMKNEPLEEFLSTTEIRINCKYQPFGCNDILYVKDKKNHEETCKYRRVRCPFKEVEKCKGNDDHIILFEDLLKHLNDFDKDQFLSIEDATFTISFGNQNDSTADTFIKILSFYDQYFLLKCNIDFQTHKFTYDLYYFSNIEENVISKYVITFTGQDDKNFKLDMKIFAIKEYYNSSRKSSEIDLNFLNQLLNNSKIITFKISLNNIPETFINILECPICTNLMVPPIFQCKLGHSICDECKKKVTECPTCENPFNETRNYLAEELSTQYNTLQKQIKCSNFKCGFRGSEDMLKKHEKVCSHKPKTCPICGMEILVELELHCKIYHGPPLFFSKNFIYVFFHVTDENKIQLGRIIFELRSDVVPKTAEYFRRLCTGEKGFGYKGSKLSVGWTTNAKCILGTDMIGGSRTIYGESFERENFILKHDRSGILTMGRSNRKTTSMFCITTTKCESFDNKHVAIGSVLVGMDIVNNILKLPKGSHCIITNCGQF